MRAFYIALIVIFTVQANAFEFERELVLSNLPDPDVYFDEGTQKYYLTGTRGTWIPIYESTDGLNFKLIQKINPTEFDLEGRTFCNIWAPDLSQRADGRIQLTFSASRSPKGSPCASIHNVTTFLTIAKNINSDFGKVVMKYHEGANAASSYQGDGCRNWYNKYDCENTIRIDANLFVDPKNNKEHFFYVWFYEGNNISSIDNSNPTDVTTHHMSSLPYEEKIVEAPDVFERNGRYYMMYSRGHFTTSYGLSYIKAKSVKGLTSNNQELKNIYGPAVRENATRCEGYTGKKIVDSGGHSSTIKGHDGNYYTYFHVNNYEYGADGCHKLKSRDTYRKRLYFAPNGDIKPFRAKYLRWRGFRKNETFRIDVQYKEGGEIKKKIGCIPKKIQQKKRWAFFNGICEDGVHIPLHKIEGVRICSGMDGSWKKTKICTDFKSLDKEVTRFRVKH